MNYSVGQDTKKGAYLGSYYTWLLSLRVFALGFS